ncbi:hypothetical protein PAHAL_6G071000 [Panicum hallii]|uniref:Epidermal patterning factor-like protein n=1 Tax=Panicum hallii TaxID=206008 RepID=A0A2T8IFH9_9POAL|nr:hypothetical protein PAHAL_6G071000 [Panicum hallii]
MRRNCIHSLLDAVQCCVHFLLALLLCAIPARAHSQLQAPPPCTAPGLDPASPTSQCIKDQRVTPYPNDDHADCNEGAEANPPSVANGLRQSYEEKNNCYCGCCSCQISCKNSDPIDAHSSRRRHHPNTDHSNSYHHEYCVCTQVASLPFLQGIPQPHNLKYARNDLDCKIEMIRFPVEIPLRKRIWLEVMTN